MPRPCTRCCAGDASISTLNISANNIGDKGAAALAEMLKSNTTLERLDLSSNVIDYDGITAISAVLVDNTSLKALYVRCVSHVLPFWSAVELRLRTRCSHKNCS